MPRNFEEWLSLALWLAGAGHFCLLIASFQVPFRLGWKEDLAKLTPFNRKLTWVHGGFTVKRLRDAGQPVWLDRKSTRLNSSHTVISYAVFCLKKKKISK